jgi:hypothetical protein
MASPAQIAASRINGARSHGPVTPEGKAISSRNALKHGLRAVDAVLPIVEDPKEFEQFTADMLQSLQPHGPQQHAIAERIVSLQWKLRRVPRIEGEAMRDLLVSNGRVIGVGVMAHDLAKTSHGRPNSSLLTLQIYEQRLQRMLLSAMRELRQLKKEQAAEEQASRAQTDSYERTQDAPIRRLHEELQMHARPDDSPMLKHLAAGPGGPPPVKPSPGDREGVA